MLFLDWKVLPLVLVFWLENVIIGVFNVIRILTIQPPKDTVFTAVFFTLHYGIFTFVHGGLLLSLFGPERFQGLNDLPGLWQIVKENHLHWAVLAMTFSHGFSYFSNFLGQGEHKIRSAKQLMMQPYGRVVFMHIGVLLGAFAVEALGSTLVALLLFIGLKIAMDLAAHIKEHKQQNVLTIAV